MFKVMFGTFLQKSFGSVPSTCTLLRRNLVQVDKRLEKKRKVSNLRKYWFNRYVDYIKNYEQTLEKNFPRAMHVYRIFSVGTKDFYRDLKKYLAAIKKQNIQGVDHLTREELQLTYTIPKDLLKISPLLLISAVPFTNYVIFPLAYYFPRQFLTSHYWTLQQRLEFMLLEQKKRLKHNRPLFRCMQAEVQSIKNNALRTKWNGVIACLGSGTHPTTSEIIACSILFSGPPYSLSSLKRKHVKELLAIHGISLWKPFRRQKLMERGMLIKRMDTAIRKEGGVTKLSNEAIRWALSFRGVNPANMSMDTMQTWLEQWLLVSEAVDTNSMSLLLHSPILLAYNHSTNWILIYK